MARKSSSKKGHREMDLFDLMIQNDESAQVDLDFLVDTPEKAQAVLDKLIGAKYISLDTEGTGLEPGPDDLSLDNDLALERVPGDLFAGFSFAISPTDAWYVPTRHYQARVLDRKWVRALLDAVLAVPRIRMHHAYHDLKVLWNFYGEEIYDRLHIRDSLVGCHTLFQSEEGADKTKRNQLGLKKLARQILNRDAGDFDSQWLGTKILRAPMADLAKYAREDAINTYLIGDWTDTETELQGTANYLENVGYPLIPVIAKAHYHGISVNRDLLHTYRMQAAEKLEEMTCHLREAAGIDINPKSDRDMDRLIYDVLGMPQVGDRRDDGLRPLAAEDLKDVLATVELQKKLGIRGYDDERVKYVEEYLEYQGLQKLYGSFILPLLEKSARDSRIYPRLLQTGTVSGRFASADPNGQNMPSGRKANIAGLHLDIRAVFMPDPGCVFITLDEGALEVRVLAHFCGEPSLVEALHLPKNQGGDPHQAAVDTIYKNTGIQITRDAAKCVDPETWVVMNGHYIRLGKRTLVKGTGTKRNREAPPEAHELGDMTFWALKTVDLINPYTVVIEEVPQFLQSGAGFILFHALERMVEASKQIELDAEPPIGREFTHNYSEHVGKVEKITVDAQSGMRSVHLKRSISQNKAQEFAALLEEAGFLIDVCV